MKEKIIIFLVGLLLGAIISTASIYVYTLANSSNNNINNNNNSMQMFENNMMEKPNNENGNPPELPSNMQNSGATN